MTKFVGVLYKIIVKPSKYEDIKPKRVLKLTAGKQTLNRDFLWVVVAVGKGWGGVEDK